MRIFVVFILLTTSCFAQQWEAVGGGVTSGMQIRDIWVDTLTDEIYISGNFWEVGGVPSNGVAKWDGTNWTNLCPECSNNQVYSILKYRDTLYIAGSFALNGTPTYAARLVGNSWESIADTEFNLARLYLHGDSLYLMGDFDTVNGNPINKVALWNHGTWVDPFPQNNFFDEPQFAYVGEMVNYQGKLIVGGNFDFGEISEITSYENGSWTNIGGGLLGDALIEHMVEFNGVLYIGGTFFQSAGNAANYLMAWNGSEFFNPFPDVEFTYNIRDLQVIDNELYVISIFNYIDDPTVYFFGKFDGDNFCSFGGSFPTIFDMNTGPPTHIRGLNNELFVVSSPVLFNDTVNRLARWTGAEMDSCIYSPVSSLAEKGADNFTFNIHPNPTTGKIAVHYDLINNGYPETVLEIVSASGTLLETVKLDPALPFTYLDYSNMADGIYFIRILIDGKPLSIEKFVVAK